MGGSDIFVCRGYSILPMAHVFYSPAKSMNHDFPWRRGFIFHANYLFFEPSESNSKAFSKTQKREKNNILRLQIYTMTICSIMSISTKVLPLTYSFLVPGESVCMLSIAVFAAILTVY